MKIQIIGIKEIDYFSKKKNAQVTGREIHYADIGNQRSGLVGNTVGSVYVSSSSPAFRIPLEVGGTYTMYLDGYKVDYLGSYVPSDDDDFDSSFDEHLSF